MKLKRDNINFDYSIKQYRTRISIDIAEYNPMMAKAKAELVASIIDAIFPIIEAKQAEFEEIYGEEVIKNAHHVPIEKTEIPTNYGDKTMTAIFKQRGDAINHVPTSDVSAGDVVVQEDLIGIAKLDIKANTLGTLALIGVFAMPKATGSGEAIAAGAKVYWDAGNLLATTDDASGANKFLGKSILAASDDEATVQVRLSQ